MKVAVVSLNNLERNGESYFGLDLVKGLRRSGIVSDFIAVNHFGRASKHDLQEEATYIRIKEMEKLNDYDFVIFNSGKFKGNYEKYDFSKIKKRKGIVLHNESSFKSYNLEELNRALQPDVVFSNDHAITNFYGKEANVLPLPFDLEKPRAEHNTLGKIIVPTRFTFSKYLQDVAKTFRKMDLELKVHFFGKKDFYYHTVRSEFEPSWNYVLNEPFSSDVEKTEVYKNAILAVDGSDFKILGERIQIVQLECFHHGVVPCMKRRWFNSFFKEGENGVALEDVNGIRRVLADEDYRNNIISNNRKLLKKYDCKVCAEKVLSVLEEECK